MKLSEFLPDVFRLAGKGINIDDYILSPEVLKIPFVKERLLQCEEFYDVEELIILDSPSTVEVSVKTGQVITSSDVDEKTKIIRTVSSIIDGGTKFKGKLYLHSFFLTPKVYDPKDLLTPVKNNISIGPIIFNDDFSSIIPLTIFINPELMQDNIFLGNEFLSKQLPEQIIEALKNREEYSCKGKRQIIIRGCFDTVEQKCRGGNEYVII